jgi:hypothetical protein
MKNYIQILCISFIIISIPSCSLTDKEKLDKILASEELYIQLNIYGGFGGYSEQKYFLKKDNNQMFLISNYETEDQIYTQLNGRESLLKSFILESYNTNMEEREMSSSCMTGFDTEYIFRTGYTTLKLRPEKKCDSIFNLILNSRN